MTVAALHAPSAPSDLGRNRIARIVAEFLQIDPAAIDPQTPFALYGLDSIRSIELVAALEDAFGRGLPEWLLIEHPDLDGLTRALRGDGDTDERDETAGMLADSRLPEDIQPSPSPVRFPARRVLLTGATGFLGAYLLRDLLDETDAQVWCLVRETGKGFKTAGGVRLPPARKASAFATLRRTAVAFGGGWSADHRSLGGGGQPDFAGFETISSGRELERVKRNFERYGLQHDAFEGRVHVIAGDLRLPNLGLTDAAYQELAQSIDAIYHAAADVNWVLPYGALRDVNVLATRDLLRLACECKPKSFHFVSSLSVCYATGGPTVVQEDDDMLPHVDRLPLGYAQSKCVAESLARQAAARGLPVQIHRPALIAGDSRTGASNLDDLVALLLKGCIEMRAAPDLDWTFDAVPVDHVSRSIVRLAHQPQRDVCVSHLSHPAPRHWRECILWMNVFGYPVKLLPYSDWLQRFERETESPQHVLHRLRSFFLRRNPCGATVPELYEEGRRSAVRSDATLRATTAAGLDCPRLTAELFDLYFAGYIARGFLPPPERQIGCNAARVVLPLPRKGERVGVGGQRSTERRSVVSAFRRTQSPAQVGCYENPRFIESVLRRHYGDSSLQINGMVLTPVGEEHSIISELTSWRHHRRSGLFRCQLTIQRSTGKETLGLVIKAKPSDRDAIDVGETVALMCDANLGRVFREHRDRIGLTGSHLRELAIYEEPDDRLRRYLPRCFGTWRDDGEGEWGLALEYLQDVVLMNTVNTPEAWSRAHVDAAIAGLSELHSVWYDREPELRAAPWLGETLSRERTLELTPLWRALARHASPYFADWAGPSICRTHRHLVESIVQWWEPLDCLPPTLIHNDFSPRNVALRSHEGRLRLCAYDWELAAFGSPQRDLAEFLCFVLPPDASAREAERVVELHRSLLEAATGRSIPADVWSAGFGSALADLLIDKLAFYAMVNRVRRQQFLPRVVRTWRRLYEIFASEAIP